MAATAWRVYNEAKKYILSNDLDVDAATMRIKIVKGTSAAAVSDYTRSTYASCGTGACGNPVSKTLSAITIGDGASAKVQRFDAADQVFTASGADATSLQYAVIGLSGGKALAWCKLSTAVFTVTSGNTLTIQFNASGIFELSGGTT
jgi:hypothetical protein